MQDGKANPTCWCSWSWGANASWREACANVHSGFSCRPDPYEQVAPKPIILPCLIEKKLNKRFLTKRRLALENYRLYGLLKVMQVRALLFMFWPASCQFNNAPCEPAKKWYNTTNLVHVCLLFLSFSFWFVRKTGWTCLWDGIKFTMTNIILLVMWTDSGDINMQ